MICNIQIHSYKLRDLSDEKYEALRTHFPQLDKNKKENYHSIEEATDLEEFLKFDLPEDIVTVTPLKRFKISETVLEKFNSDKTLSEKLQTINTVHLSMPGFELSLFNEVRVEENCCTDEINNLMKEGWKILAILPQPNHRRPDYIMGKK